MPLKSLSSLLACTLLAACVSSPNDPLARIADADLSLGSGLPSGTAQLVARGDRLYLVVAAAGLEPGEHGFHLHTTGRCTAPDFTSAGGHLNPFGRAHGSLAAGGKHLGDLPNLSVGSNRMGTAEVELPGDRAQTLDHLFDEDGTAVVIHVDPDDYRTDPTGNAGSRVACGVLRRQG